MCIFYRSMPVQLSDKQLEKLGIGANLHEICSQAVRRNVQCIGSYLTIQISFAGKAVRNEVREILSALGFLRVGSSAKSCT